MIFKINKTVIKSFLIFMCFLSAFQTKAQMTPYFPGMQPCHSNTVCPWFVCNWGINDQAINVVNPIKTEYCVGEQITFNYIGTYCASDVIYMGDCANTAIPNASGYSNYSPPANPFAFGSNINFLFSYNLPGDYTVAVVADGHCYTGCYLYLLPIKVVDCVDSDKPDCLQTFAPTAGTYMLSFWVKEERSASFFATNTSYVSGIDVTLNATTTQYYADGTFNVSNKIIDGWQKVDAVITIPPGTTSIDIKLQNNSVVDAYFDDIRFHPFNSAFKSYVYDPVSLRLVAELDDRNYATLYEYDEEGKLIRVKKETERGIKTIKESRTSIKK